MTQYIDKAAVVAEIERMQDAYIAKLESRGMGHEEAAMASISYVNGINDVINSLEVKEAVDLDFQKFAKEMDAIFALPSSETKNTEEPLNWEYAIAKHFFELGMRVNNPITAADRGMVEEIITHLKRVEQDYRINLTKEMEWLRNQVKAQKGE